MREKTGGHIHKFFPKIKINGTCDVYIHQRQHANCNFSAKNAQRAIDTRRVSRYHAGMGARHRKKREESSSRSPLITAIKTYVQRLNSIHASTHPRVDGKANNELAENITVRRVVEEREQ